MLFDSHTHMNNDGLSFHQRERIAKDIEQSNVSYVVDIGFDVESSAVAVKHAEKYSWCFATVGIHPHNAKDMDGMSLQMIKALAKKPKVKAIGETGLDFFRDLSPRDVQRQCFRAQIRLANELKMPIVVHSRDADGEVLDILREEQGFSSERRSWFPQTQGKVDSRVLLHCYSGHKEIALQYVKLGAMISIAGPITYKNARKSVEVVEAVPIEYLLIETDAPYLTPEPLRGQRNKSANVEYVAKKVAEIKGMTYEDVARITCENAKSFYGIE
jgi:TatD DNase family protein